MTNIPSILKTSINNDNNNNNNSSNINKSINNNNNRTDYNKNLREKSTPMLSTIISLLKSMLLKKI